MKDSNKQVRNASIEEAGWAALSVFQRRVYGRLLEVPAGRVTTYAALARAAGCGSARAVGQILRRNPLAPWVPCHRVIRSDGGLGGFLGAGAGPVVAQKRRLLEGEGVLFVGGRLADPERLYGFEGRS